MTPGPTVPELSLGAWRAGGASGAAFAAELCRCCHDVGFLQVVDHGIDRGALDRLFDTLAAFFALPEDVKAGIDKRTSRNFRGWERVGSELTDNRVDHREQIDLATEHEPWPPDATPAYLRLDGPNQWPDESLVPGFRDAVETFVAGAAAVAESLLAALSQGLGLAPGALADVFGARRHSLVKLIRYPVSPPGEAGVNAHHDAGFLTVLAQHEVAGLQALAPDGRWVDVVPRRDALVVNLGEMLQAMTGNYVVATKHRVVTSAERLSAAYFHGPDLRTRLDPLPLAPSFAAAVAASPRHAGAGFMARREDLLAGERGTGAPRAATYGEQLWNYYRRSYPEHVRVHHPDASAEVAGG